MSEWVGLVGGIIGAIGGVISIVTSIRAHRREADKEMDRENDFNLRASLMQKQIEVGSKAGQIFTEIEIGSPLWRRAEDMVERGVLARGPNGRGYCLPGFYDQKKLENERRARG